MLNFARLGKENRPDWRQDDQAMREEMFFGKAPTFDEIIRVVGDFAEAFNSVKEP